MAMAGVVRRETQYELAYVRLAKGEWSIARAVVGGPFQWWCGDRHDWVSPGSSYWEICMRHDWQIEFRTLEGAIGIGAPEEIEQLLLIPLARGHFRDNLLGEYIERLLGNPQAVEFAAAHGIQQGSAFDEIVA